MTTTMEPVTPGNTLWYFGTSATPQTTTVTGVRPKTIAVRHENGVGLLLRRVAENGNGEIAESSSRKFYALPEQAWRGRVHTAAVHAANAIALRDDAVAEFEAWQERQEATS